MRFVTVVHALGISLRSRLQGQEVVVASPRRSADAIGSSGSVQVHPQAPAASLHHLNVAPWLMILIAHL